MDAQAWKMKRAQLAEKEKQERRADFEQGRVPLQIAITEQCIRELYDMQAELRPLIEDVTKRLSELEQKRSR